jgi:hypothetical protein
MLIRYADDFVVAFQYKDGGLVLLMGSVVYAGKDITEEPDAVIPCVGICLGTVWAAGSSTKVVGGESRRFAIVKINRNLLDFCASPLNPLPSAR